MPVVCPRVWKWKFCHRVIGERTDGRPLRTLTLFFIFYHVAFMMMYDVYDVTSTYVLYTNQSKGTFHHRIKRKRCCRRRQCSSIHTYVLHAIVAPPLPQRDSKSTIRGSPNWASLVEARLRRPFLVPSRSRFSCWSIILRLFILSFQNDYGPQHCQLGLSATYYLSKTKDIPTNQ